MVVPALMARPVSKSLGTALKGVDHRMESGKPQDLLVLQGSATESFGLGGSARNPERPSARNHSPPSTLVQLQHQLRIRIAARQPLPCMPETVHQDLLRLYCENCNCLVLLEGLRQSHNRLGALTVLEGRQPLGPAIYNRSLGRMSSGLRQELEHESHSTQGPQSRGSALQEVAQVPLKYLSHSLLHSY